LQTEYSDTIKRDGENLAKPDIQKAVQHPGRTIYSAEDAGRQGEVVGATEAA